MPSSDLPRVHPTAIVSPRATLAPDVIVGPFSILDGAVNLGPGCVVGPHCHFVGTVTVGPNNTFGTCCVIGDKPQHLAYKDEETRVEIGAGNIFREHVTVHRAMPVGGHVTTIGDRNLFMVNSHVAHDCHVGDHCIFANGAVVGGHAVIMDRALLSGNSAVHQNCRVGRLALIGGTSAISQDLPPFWICQGSINVLQGVNIVGMRRAGMGRDEIQAVRHAYRWLNRSGLTIPDAVREMEAHYPTVPAIRELIEFIAASKRGICTGHRFNTDAAGPDA